MKQSLLRLSAHHGPAKYIRHSPVTPPNPSKTHVFISKTLGGFMSFWICLRFKEDGAIMFVSVSLYWFKGEVVLILE